MSLTRRRELRPEMKRRFSPKWPVPHPFAFFLAKGSDTTSLNQPVHQDRSPPRPTESNAGVSNLDLFHQLL